LFWEKISH